MAFRKKRCFSVFAGILTGIIFLFVQPLFAVEIPITTAEDVAQNFITYLDETYNGDNDVLHGAHYTVDKIEPLENSDQSQSVGSGSGKIVGYVVKLNPQGYILVAGDTIRVPIKAYSLTSNFENLPSAYVKVLLDELKIDSSTKSASSKSAINQLEAINQSYWDFLTQANIVSRKSLRSYTPDTFLLTTKWDQGYPYNKFNPKSGDELTVTGCVQTAVAQIMRYHSYPSSGSGIFTHSWGGKNLTAVMNRPFNWSSMPNSVDGSVPQYQQDEVAALMRDLGVLNEALFDVSSKGGTSAYFHSDEFERAFSYAPVEQMESSNANFFTTIRNEIDALRPVLLMIPNHATVADGYASDASGKKIHVNLGWGGTSDDYYYLDQTNIIQGNSYPYDHTIYYNIKPCKGGECNPYTPTASGNSPVIGSYQNGSLVSFPNDITIDGVGSDIIRVENYDPDGDTVTLAATSSSNKLQTNLVGNLLTITPTATNIFCNVTIKAQSYDGAAEKVFKVLVLDEMLYIGTNYDISGQFANQTEIDQYKAYFGGNTTISGDNGYSSQGFYIWVKDNNGNIVISASPEEGLPVSGTLTPGLYTIYSSLKNTFTNWSYPYKADHSAYTLTVTCNSLTATVSDLAASMGIALSDDTTLPPLPQSINSYKVLTAQSNQVTIKYGDYVKIFGSSSVTNTINIESGGRVECVNFVGANVLNIADKAADFTVYRSGATVYLESSTKGTKIKIPATTTYQTLSFENGSSPISLFINGGNVMLGNLAVGVGKIQL